jgi:hypothetical protein
LKLYLNNDMLTIEILIKVPHIEVIKDRREEVGGDSPLLNILGVQDTGNQHNAFPVIAELRPHL